MYHIGLTARKDGTRAVSLIAHNHYLEDVLSDFTGINIFTL